MKPTIIAAGKISGAMPGRTIECRTPRVRALTGWLASRLGTPKVGRYCGYRSATFEDLDKQP
jgi:hypothetical protein